MTFVNKKLNKLRDAVSPCADWKRINRGKLMRVICVEETQAAPTSLELLANSWSIFLKNSFITRLGHVSLVVVMSFAIVSNVGQFTVGSSIPGDKLYFVKRSLERAQMHFTTNTSEKINLEMAFIENRLNELEQLEADTQTEKTQNTLGEIKIGFDQVAISLEEAGKNSKTSVVEMAKLVDMKSVEVSNKLKTAQVGADDFVVAATISSVENAGLKALKVMAETVDKGDAVNEEEAVVTERILNRIDLINETPQEQESPENTSEEEVDDFVLQANTFLKNKDLVSAVSVLETMETQETGQEEDSILESSSLEAE